MPATAALCVILLLCCLRLVVSGNTCPAGTFNSLGTKCDVESTFKYADNYPHCLGGLSGSTMDYTDAAQHCWGIQGDGPAPDLVLTESIAENNAVQVWRSANSAAKKTWMSGKRTQSSSKTCPKTHPAGSDWAPWYWNNFANGYASGADPWDGGEPKSNCYPSQEKCYSMNENGRWRDRNCDDDDDVYALCQKDHLACDACNTQHDCNAGSYRTTCPGGSTSDSTCTLCTNSPTACAANNRMRYCAVLRNFLGAIVGTETMNQCVACDGRPSSCNVAGKWWKPCDVAAFTDTGSCNNCLAVECVADQHKQLCAAGGFAERDNGCSACARTSCGPGEFLTRCNHLTDTSDTSNCTTCAKPSCAVGTYRKTCVVPETSDTCPLCRTDTCGIGYYRQRCNGTQAQNAECQTCADNLVCGQDEYEIPCDGEENGVERNSSTCNACPPNSGSPVGSTDISSCECKDDYVVGDSVHACVVCSSGTVKVGGICELCEAGTQRTAAQSVCTACPVGQYKEEGLILCASCEQGKYLNTTGATSETTCQKCAAGKYSAATGAGSATTCTGCIAGTQCPRDGMAAWELCPAGTASNTVGTITCAACGAGTFSPPGGAYTCTNCYQGQFQDLTAQASCKRCVPGKVSSGVGATVCALCAPGKFNAQYEKSVCLPCQHHWLYAPNEGATICLECASAGYETIAAVNCTACMAGKYKTDNSQRQCDNCLAVRSAISALNGGIAPLPASDRCTPCEWYKYWENATRCEMCAPGTFLDRTLVPAVCSPCQLLDAGYCAGITQEMVDLSLLPSYGLQSSFEAKCRQSVLFTNNNTAAKPMCTGCACSLFRDAMSEEQSPSCQTDGDSRLFFDGQIRSCRYCPVNRNINNHVSHRSCDQQDGTKHTEWDSNTGTSRCVPGYRHTFADPACVACDVGTYQDKVGAASCTMCPGNTTTPNQGSISRHDCAWCSFNQRVVQNADTGAFSCRACEMCSVVREGMHMLSSCTPCSYYEYDEKQANHPSTCVLVLCLDKVRTDGFSQDAGTLRADEQFGLISKKDTDSGKTWTDGFILMFVTEFRWMSRFSQLDALGQSQRLDALQTLDENFEQTRMFSGIADFNDLETSFVRMRDAGAPIYISFRDLFFRIFMHMALQTIYFNGATRYFESDWNAENLDADNDWVAYYEKIRQTGAIYMTLETSRRAQESIVSADYQHAVAPSGAALACAAVGTLDSMLHIVQPANGASFSITTLLIFADVPITASQCLAGSECEKMFVADTDFITMNNTHPSIVFHDFYMFLLEDIMFDVKAATGANVLDFELTTPSVSGRPAVKVEATLYWRRKPTTYQACSRSHTAAKHAVISDPVAFTQIRKALHRDQCTNVDYA